VRVGAPLIQQIFPLFPDVWEVWATAFRLKFFLFYLIDCLVYSFLHFKSILRAKESRLTLLIGLIEFLCCPTEQNSLMLLFVISCKVTLSTLAAYTPGFFFIFFNFNVICMKLLEHKLDWANHMRKWLVMPKALAICLPLVMISDSLLTSGFSSILRFSSTFALNFSISSLRLKSAKLNCLTYF